MFKFEAIIESIGIYPFIFVLEEILNKTSERASKVKGIFSRVTLIVNQTGTLVKYKVGGFTL